MAAAGCTARPLSLRFARRDGATVLTVAKPRVRPKTRYTCAKVKGGIRLTARSTNGRPLSRAMGSTLGLGIYKATDGPPSSGRLTLTFGLR